MEKDWRDLPSSPSLMTSCGPARRRLDVEDPFLMAASDATSIAKPRSPSQSFALQKLPIARSRSVPPVSKHHHNTALPISSAGPFETPKKSKADTRVDAASSLMNVPDSPVSTKSSASTPTSSSSDSLRTSSSWDHQSTHSSVGEGEWAELGSRDKDSTSHHALDKPCKSPSGSISMIGDIKRPISSLGGGGGSSNSKLRPIPCRIPDRQKVPYFSRIVERGQD